MVILFNERLKVLLISCCYISSFVVIVEIWGGDVTVSVTVLVSSNILHVYCILHFIVLSK